MEGPDQFRSLLEEWDAKNPDTGEIRIDAARIENALSSIAHLVDGEKLSDIQRALENTFLRFPTLPSQSAAAKFDIALDLNVDESVREVLKSTFLSNES